MSPDLTGKQRRYLRSLGHHLDPVVQIGQQGLTDAVVRAAGGQLDAHELIKVRISENVLQERRELAEDLARRTGAQLAQVLGRTALLYRPRKEKPAIVLPKGKD